MTIQDQQWHDFSRYLILHDYGSVQLTLYYNIQDDGGSAYIHSLWVRTYHRRHGIATELLDAAEKIAKNRGHKSVMLDWEAKETPREILDWYIRRGYKVIGHFREDSYTLEKDLLE